MRPVTTLKSNPEFRLPKAEQRTGFVALYNSQIGMSPYEFMFQLTSRLVYHWAAQEDEIPNSRSLKDYIEAHVKDGTRKAVVKSVLRKNNMAKTLEFKTPIFRKLAVGDAYLETTGDWAFAFKFPTALGPDHRLEIKRSVKTIEDTVFAGGRILTGEQVVNICKFSGRQAEMLKKCLDRVEAVKDGDQFIVWATWKISQKEAEYLNNVPFNQIKLGNMYPTLIDWSANVIGKDTNIPDTICPISSITAGVEHAKTQGPVKPRVGIAGAVVDVNRHFYIIPDVNQSLEYEQQLLEFGTQEDGSYTWNQKQVADQGDGIPVGNMTRKKLPINMPIYADWLNDKFVYSNSVGNLDVYDLSNTAPVSNFHITTLLDSEINTSSEPNYKGSVWAIICTAVDLAANFDRTILDQRPIAQEVGEGAQEYRQALGSKNYAHFRDMAPDAFQLHLKSVGNTEDMFVGKISGGVAVRIHQLYSLPAFKWMFRACQDALNALKANIEVMYTRYSVMNVLQQLAILQLVVENAPRQGEVAYNDRQERDVYLTQGVDPEYQVEDVPSIKAGLKYLPHQAKCQNTLRRGPKLAVIPVDAGGGKTIIIMTNILLELKRRHCVKPIILCPAHLVSQYIKEVVYVTEGRLNIIPVTNSSFKAHGEEKLKKFIDNAPLNTIVVTDMNFLSGRRQRVAYGNKSIDVYRNAEFMRQFEFDLIAVDEVHFLKNLKSNRRDAAARFLQDIPMKRIASGTLVSDTLKDLVSQIALMDPVIFGSEEEFKREFADKTRGSKVLGWKPGAEKEVRGRIMEHMVMAGARRKEWAALLPPKIDKDGNGTEKFHAVEMTKNQRLLYESILAETMELIEAAMARDAEVREMMDSEDDSKAEELEAKLRPYLARLERFMSAPDADPAAQVFLSDPMDLISPKVTKVYDIFRKHLEQGIKGKVLVFTQYTASAKSVFDNAPADLKPYMIHYTAGAKAECKVEFENNPKKMLMVGVSSSMDTGLNLQHASRLIRLETVWTPGVLEQGNSRINRPEMKKDETREAIYLDWIIINKSIDITKVARLISKIISKAKFDESDNPAYDEIPAVTQVQMTMDSIAAYNDFQEELFPYLEAYQTYQQIEEADYAEYKRQQGDKITPIEVPQGGLLEGSKLMSRVPYIPEMELYGVDKLGLVRYDHYIRQDLSALEEDSDEDTEEEDEGTEDDTVSTDPKVLKKQARRKALLEERLLTKGKPVHTDFGDGTITYVGPTRVLVRLADGTIVRVFKLQTYIITRTTTNGIDMRNELLKQVGKIPLDAPITVPVEEGPQETKRRAKAAGERPAVPKTDVPAAEFDFTVMNDFLALMYRGDGKDTEMVSTLQNFGFRITPEYKYVKIFGPKMMLAFFRALKAQNFTLGNDTSSELKRIYEALAVNKKAMSTFGFAASMKVTNFYREQIKPSSDPFRLKVYPLVQDGILYLLFPTKGQPANQKASRVTSHGITWKMSQDSELVRLFTNKVAAKDAVKEMRDAGVNIPPANLKELETQFKNIRIVSR